MVTDITTTETWRDRLKREAESAPASADGYSAAGLSWEDTKVVWERLQQLERVAYLAEAIAIWGGRVPKALLESLSRAQQTALRKAGLLPTHQSTSRSATLAKLRSVGVDL